MKLVSFSELSAQYSLIDDVDTACEIRLDGASGGLLERDSLPEQLIIIRMRRAVIIKY